MATLIPFLMFEGHAEEAMTRYVEVVPDSRITRLEHHREGSGPDGQVLHGEAVVAGQLLRFFDSPVNHAFTFTPALSLYVTVATAEELDAIAEGLAQEFLMPTGDYGFSTRFAWFNDAFGVSWQVTLQPQP